MAGALLLCTDSDEEACGNRDITEQSLFTIFRAGESKGVRIQAYVAMCDNPESEVRNAAIRCPNAAT